MNPSTIAVYASLADRKERDPIQDGSQATRATVPMGRGFALWQRMNPQAQLVWIDDAEGHPRAVTPKQAIILSRVLEMAAGAKGVTMRALAQELRMAPSTISRALTKFAAWGLIAYFCGRGRFAGLVIFRRAKDDQWEYLRKAAKARVRRWSEAAERRVSRLWINVASYFHGEEGGISTQSYRDMYYYSSKDATLTAQRPWTPEELREAGII